MRHWPETRATLIALAIVFGLVDGCPLPAQPAPWQRPIVGLVRPVQQVVEWPVAWLRPTLRVTQQWALFQAAGTERYRMSVEGRRGDGTWLLVYRAGDREHVEDASVLEYRRIRGAWDPTTAPPGQYRGFASWFTARVLDRHPELVAARVRMAKIVIDGAGYAPTGQFLWTYVRTRGAR